MSSLQRNRIRNLALAVGSTLALSGIAHADGAKASADPSLGIMTFANVSVVNDQNPSAKPVEQKHAEGLKAYLDPKTRKLRAQTGEERNKDAEEFAARQAAKDKASSARSAANTDLDAQGNEARTLHGPSGAVGVQLTDEHMIYQVAHETSDGLARQEVTGSSAAKQAMKDSKKDVSQGEVSHDR